MIALLAISIAISASGNYRTRFQLPDFTVPSGWGVNIHFTDPKPGEMQMLAATGLKWVRMDFFWNRIEKVQGRYDFSSYDRLVRSLQAYKIRPIFILDYGNDLYEHGSPRSDLSRTAFCRWVSASVRHFNNVGVIWEMWNEPNIQFWTPKPDVNQYTALAVAVGKTIRSVAPEQWFIGPATSSFDWPFLAGCFKAGLLRYWDAVSVHPYRGAPPESVVPDWRKLRFLIDRYAPRHRKIPMYSGEWGYSTTNDGLTDEKQGQYAIRQYIWNLSAGVPLSIWYDWHDDGTNPKEVEHHFGLVYNDYRPKPAYNAIKALIDALKGSVFERMEPSLKTSKWVATFRKGRRYHYIRFN